MFTSNSLASLRVEKKQKPPLIKQLELYKLAESKILNSTFVNESNRNPNYSTTFGNPYALDKFNRKTFCKEFKNDLKGKSSPAMNSYY